MKLTGKWLSTGKWVVLCLMAMAFAWMANAQTVTTTTVQGTVYLANGKPGTGSLQLSWPAFTTANNQAVAAGRTTVTIGVDGFVSVNLAPNLGSWPAGLYYTATYYLSDGTTSTEYWVVPAAAQASIAQVRTQVMPAAQAVQAVSKAYVDQAIQSIPQSSLTPSGGTMSGPLYLSGDPLQALQAADKHYVDSALSQVVPLTGATLTGPINGPSLNASVNKVLLVTAPPYNAKCDGATDDQTAIQAAFNDAYSNGYSVQFPAGTCLTSTIILKGQSFFGAGVGLTFLKGQPGQDVFATPDAAAALLANGSIRDLTIQVDASVNAASSVVGGNNTFPNRITGTAGGTTPLTTPPAPGPMVFVNGASGNCGGSIGASSSTLTVSCAYFTSVASSLVIGKAITVNGAGTAGANLVTTVASVVSGTQVTLATPASATVSNTTVTLAAPTTPPWYIGNCGIALPASSGAAMASNLLDWSLTNVYFQAVNGPGIGGNYTCGLFVQAEPYAWRYTNLDFANFWAGLIEAPPASNNASYNDWTPDTSSYKDINFRNTILPMVWYNGSNRTAQGINIYGTQRLFTLGMWQFATSLGSSPTAYPNGTFTRYYDECFTPATGEHARWMTADSNADVFAGSEPAICGGTSYLNFATSNSTIDGKIGSTLQINGNRNVFTNTGLLAGETTDNGLDNSVQAGEADSNPGVFRRDYVGSIPPQEPVGKLDAGFVLSGSSTTPFLSGGDLVFTARDFVLNAGSNGTAVNDPSGSEMTHSYIHTSGTAGFNSGGAGHNGLFVAGTRVPLAKTYALVNGECEGATACSTAFKVWDSTTNAQIGYCYLNFTSTWSTDGGPSSTDQCLMDFSTVSAGDLFEFRENSWAGTGLTGVRRSFIAFEPVNKDLSAIYAPSIATLAALRTYSGSSKILNLLAYYSSTSIGGGIFNDVGAGSAGDDNGGTTIYDSATGHDWKRQFDPSVVNSAWFGVKTDGTDQSANLQAAFNFMCSSAHPGRLQLQQGLINFGTTLNKNCSFPVWGAGVQGYQRGGTTLAYTGTGTDAILFNGISYNDSREWWQDLELLQSVSSPTTWTNALGFTPPPTNDVNAMFIQGGGTRVAFTNWTGADMYFHVTLPTTTTAITGYISDGTGTAAGQVLCVTSGTIPSGDYISGTGIPSYTYELQSLGSSSAWPVTCTGSGGGTPYLINQSLNIPSETMQVGNGSSAYFQEDEWSDVYTSGDAQFIGTDPTASFPQNNIFILKNFAHENAQTVSAGVSSHYMDLRGFAGVTIDHLVYEGGTVASPNLFAVPSASPWFRVSGLYVENGSPSYPLNNIFDVVTGYYEGPNIDFENSYLGGCTYCSAGYTFVFQPYISDSHVSARNVGAISYINVGNAKRNTVEDREDGFTGMSADMLGSHGVNNSYVRSSSTNAPLSTVLNIAKATPFLDAHGPWMDGLKKGIASVSVSGAASEGFVTDSTEGRVFEIVSATNGTPGYTIAIQPTADMVGQQVVVAIRWQLKTSQTAYGICPLTTGYFGAATMFNSSFSAGYGGGGCMYNAFPHNTWTTSYFAGYIANTSPTGIATALGVGSAASSGVQTLDIAAIYIAAGTGFPYTIGGANAAETLKWSASAAPTYGSYIVGDTVINSVPASGQPFEWVNTTAGSPGTWTAQTAPTSVVTSVAATAPLASSGGATPTISISSAQGTGSKVQLSTGATTTGDCVQYDASGNTTDAGSPCGSGSGGGLSLNPFTYFNDFLVATAYKDYVAGSIGSPGSGHACGPNINPSATNYQNHPGVLVLTSGTTSGAGESCYSGNANTSNTEVLPAMNLSANPWTWQTSVNVPVLPGTTAGSYTVGLYRYAGTFPWVNGLWFSLSSSNGVPNDWYCGYGSGTATLTDSGVAAGAATWATLKMAQDGTKLHWYIAGTEVCGTGVALASIPNAVGSFEWDVVAGTSTSMEFDVDYVYLQMQVTR